MPILECDDLRKTFAGGFEAVRGITFDIEEGEAFGLLGPNGAGKTTTMRMLGTLLTPTGGTGDASRGTTSCASPAQCAVRSASRCRRPDSRATRPAAST